MITRERRSTKEEASVNEEGTTVENEGCRENKGLQERQAPIGSRKRGVANRGCVYGLRAAIPFVCVPIELFKDCLC